MAVLKVSGTVSTINAQHNFVKFWESFDFKGQERHRLWTAWYDQIPNLNEGDWVEIEGSLGTKVGKYQKPGEDEKTVVEHSLNDCALIQHQPKQVGNTAPAEVPASWEPIIDPASAPF